MRKIIVTFLMIIVCFIMQTTLFRYFSFGEIVPDCLMIITASTGMMRGEKTGLVTGFCCGLLADIFFADFIGLSALLYMYAGFFSGLFHRIFFPENYILPLAITIFNTFIKEFVTYMLLFLLRARFSLGHYMTHTIIPEVVYTAIIAVFLYPVILNINTWIDRIVQRGARKFV